jgi:hypothetical protein
VAAPLRKVCLYQWWIRQKKLGNIFFDNLYCFCFICLVYFVPERTPYPRTLLVPITTIILSTIELIFLQDFILNVCVQYVDTKFYFYTANFIRMAKCLVYFVGTNITNYMTGAQICTFPFCETGRGSGEGVSCNRPFVGYLFHLVNLFKEEKLPTPALQTFESNTHFLGHLFLYIQFVCPIEIN